MVQSQALRLVPRSNDRRDRHAFAKTSWARSSANSRSPDNDCAKARRNGMSLASSSSNSTSAFLLPSCVFVTDSISREDTAIPFPVLQSEDDSVPVFRRSPATLPASEAAPPRLRIRGYRFLCFVFTTPSTQQSRPLSPKAAEQAQIVFVPNDDRNWAEARDSPLGLGRRRIENGASGYG